MKDSPTRITGRAVLLGLLFTVLFAILTPYFTNRHDIHLTANQIPVLPYVLLLLTVLLVNPLCCVVRFIRPFSIAETLVIFSMGLVSAGISTFGLSEPLIPIVGSLFNRHWNNNQTEWNRYVEPFINESYFVSVPGIRDAADRYRTALDEADAEQALYVAAASCPASEAAPRHFAALQAKRAAAEEARVALADLEQKAQQKVESFRRGLPPSLRAFPGFLPISGEDDMSSYLARLKRLVVGRRALAELRTAMAALKQAKPGAIPDAALQDSAGAALARAAALLDQGSDAAPFLARKAVLDAEAKRLSAQVAETETHLAALSAERRNAIGNEIRKTDARVVTLGKTLSRLKKEDQAGSLRRELVSRHLMVATNVSRVVAGLRECRSALASRTAAESREALKSLRLQFPSIDATFTRFLVGDIPWTDWLGPLWRWSTLILLSYLMLFAFNVLIFRQWAHNEKLIYPLAELPELLAGYNDETGGRVPAIFRSALFWTGFAISGLTLGWNILCDSGAIPGLTPINLSGRWQPYILNTPLQGLLPSAQSAIFFTMIGLSFLIPTKVSFSLWFFSILYMLQLLVMVGLNLGVNEGSFPREWWYTLNFRSAEGGGALLVFASVVLWKCRRYLLCAFMPGVTRELEADERTELRFSSVLFLASIVGVTLILWRGLGASLGHTLFCLFIILVITIGLVRAVTEGGILGFQCSVSPFHFIRTLFGMNTPATAPSLFAPLLVYYAVLFLDVKAFIAPAMANTLKLRDDLRLSRARFHALLGASIILAALVSLITILILSYSKGADSMGWWFPNAFPKSLFDKIASMTKTPPLPAPTETGWMAFGAAAMAALLYFRQSLFWLPHPIGLIMLVNPLMASHWFSILLGWFAKFLVTRYGSKHAYLRIRGLFVGLIAGELIMVLLAMILSLTLDHPIPLDLNR